MNNLRTEIDNLCGPANNTVFNSTINITLDKLKISKYDPRGYDDIQAHFAELLKTGAATACSKDVRSLLWPIGIL